jgi:hypothetical protein
VISIFSESKMMSNPPSGIQIFPPKLMLVRSRASNIFYGWSAYCYRVAWMPESQHGCLKEGLNYESLKVLQCDVDIVLRNTPPQISGDFYFLLTITFWSKKLPSYLDRGIGKLRDKGEMTSLICYVMRSSTSGYMVLGSGLIISTCFESNHFLFALLICGVMETDSEYRPHSKFSPSSHRVFS